MVIKKCRYLDENFVFKKGSIEIQGERIAGFNTEPCSCNNIIDGQGLTVLPGFIDIHIHGCMGADVSDGEISSLEAISSYLATVGVTSFMPTTISLDREKLERVFAVLGEFFEKGEAKSYPVGINMEGPYISKIRKGAHSEAALRRPDIREFYNLLNLSKNNIKLVTVAPEIDDGFRFISEISKICSVSLGHTDADYTTTINAIKAGASHSTHLYNAMSHFNHREPGAAGGIIDSEVTTELISDGIHLAPAVLRMAFKAMGEDRICIVSDSMSAAGMPDGEYHLGNEKVVVKNAVARLADGSLAGSTTNVFESVKKLIGFGIPIEQAVKAASLNPAKVARVNQYTGSIKTGKYADLLIIDDNFELRYVIIKGRIVHKK